MAEPEPKKMIPERLENAVKFAWNYLVTPPVVMVMNVPDEVARIKAEVKEIHARSREAYRVAAEAEEGDTRDRMESRARQLREVAFHMEDTIDEYKNKKKVQQPCCYPGYGALPCHDADFVKITYCHRLQIAVKIKCIQSELLKIDKRIEKEDSKVKSSSEQGRRSQSTTAEMGNKWESLREEAIHMPPEDIVGFEDPCEKLIGWLEKNQEKCSVFAVVGMGGQGKTTLARKIFKNEEAMVKFNCRAWINVSQFHTPEELFNDLLQQLCKQANKPPPPQGTVAINEVRKHLKKKRYILFFDEVWEQSFWEKIKIRDFVGCNNYGSRIIITTRSKKVAWACRGSTYVEVHEMQPLTIEDSLKLFHQTAFRFDDDGSCKEQCGDEMPCKIVEECKGLPLAIVAIGKLVAVEPNLVSKWKINIEKAGITKNLSLGFDDLDDNLKLCFLYFGIYPQDYEVKSKRLTRQWISEGFVRSEEGKTLEEVAEEYLDVLIHTNLVQVSSFSFDGRPRTCGVHYLIHDMILRQLENFGFCGCISEDDQSEIRRITRRLSIATNCSEDLPGYFDNLTKRVERKFIQSLLFFTKEVVVTAEFVESIPKTYQLLKVLDFENARLSCVQDLGGLIYLKYLSLRNTGIQNLPRSIGKLHNLETLDLRQTAVKEIPKEVTKLTKLRHLLGNDMSLVQLKEGIGGMKSLQTLLYVKIDGHGVELIRELGKLWHLRDLRLTNVTGEHGSDLCSSLNKMEHLKKLHIVVAIAKPVNEVIDLHNLRLRPELRKLRLQGTFKLPEWVSKLSNERLVLSR